MSQGGECLACLKLNQCRETSVEKVLSSFTCSLFHPVHEAVFRARWDSMKQYGEVAAVRGMLHNNPNTHEGEEDDA